MTKSRTDTLLSRAIPEASLVHVGRYTKPPTWGVYELPLSLGTKRFRMGNHPVRHRELQHEFGSAKTVALFDVRELAVELSGIYNRNGRVLGA